MNNTSYSHIHGYSESALDNAIRVHLIDGRVIALTLTPKGVEGRLLSQKLRLPGGLRKIYNSSSLVMFLKNHRLSVVGQRIVLDAPQTGVPFTTDVKTSPPVSQELLQKFQPLFDNTP